MPENKSASMSRSRLDGLVRDRTCCCRENAARLARASWAPCGGGCEYDDGGPLPFPSKRLMTELASSCRRGFPLWFGIPLGPGWLVFRADPFSTFRMGREDATLTEIGSVFLGPGLGPAEDANGFPSLSRCGYSDINRRSSSENIFQVVHVPSNFTNLGRSSTGMRS